MRLLGRGSTVSMPTQGRAHSSRRGKPQVECAKQRPTRETTGRPMLGETGPSRAGGRLSPRLLRILHIFDSTPRLEPNREDHEEETGSRWHSDLGLEPPRAPCTPRRPTVRAWRRATGIGSWTGITHAALVALVVEPRQDADRRC